MPTDVCTWDWQAIATFVTGFFAVGGAVIVGWRQAGILERQTIIQELTLKHELFDRRYSVFERTREFLVAILQRGDFPTPEIERAFLLSMGEARFLFDGLVRDGLDQIWRDAEEYRLAKDAGDYANAQKFFQTIEQRLKEISDLFVEMKLS